MHYSNSYFIPATPKKILSFIIPAWRSVLSRPDNDDTQPFGHRQDRLFGKAPLIPNLNILQKCKYARTLLFQFVFTKYVFAFRNYDGLTFVAIVVFYKIVIRHNYDKIHYALIRVNTSW